MGSENHAANLRFYSPRVSVKTGSVSKSGYLLTAGPWEIGSVSGCQQLLSGTVSLRSTPPQAVPPSLTLPRVACVPKRTAEHLADNLVCYHYATIRNREDAHLLREQNAKKAEILRFEPNFLQKRKKTIKNCSHAKSVARLFSHQYIIAETLTIIR